MANFEAIKDTVFATDVLEREKDSLHEEMNVVAGLIQQCVRENARVALDQEEYQARYDSLADRFEKAKARLETVSMEITEKQARREMTEQFLAELAKQEGVVMEFDEDLWYALVDFVTVFNKEDVRFTFKDGTEIKVVKNPAVDGMPQDFLQPFPDLNPPPMRQNQKVWQNQNV